MYLATFMNFNTTYLDSWSSPPSTIASYIHYGDTLFERANLTSIRCKPTYKTLHKLQNKIKASLKSVYSNLGRVSHGHISLVLTEAQYELIFNTPFSYPTHLGPLIVSYGTTNHMNLNMRITHTNAVHLFRELTGVDPSLIQKIITIVEEAYLVKILNQTTNPINNTMADVLAHLHENYRQIMPHKLLKRKGMANKTIYHPHEPIASIFSIVK